MKKSCATCGYTKSLWSPCSNCVNFDWWAPRESEISHPDYYRKNGIECFQAIDAAICNLQGADAFDTGNAIKYLWRWREKNGVEDLKKAVVYIQRIIEREEKPCKLNAPTAVV